MLFLVCCKDFIRCNEACFVREIQYNHLVCDCSIKWVFLLQIWVFLVFQAMPLEYPNICHFLYNKAGMSETLGMSPSVLNRESIHVPHPSWPVLPHDQRISAVFVWISSHIYMHTYPEGRWMKHPALLPVLPVLANITIDCPIVAYKEQSDLSHYTSTQKHCIFLETTYNYNPAAAALSVILGFLLAVRLMRNGLLPN